MTIEKNFYSYLLDIVHETTVPNKPFVRGERALAITVVALLLLAVCTFAKVGVFASLNYSSSIGFCCIGLSAYFVFVKGILLSLQCCKSSIKIHATNGVACRRVDFSEEDLRDAIPN